MGSRPNPGTAQQPTPVEAQQLNMLRAGGMLGAGALIIALDGSEMRWRVGGSNGAPAVYFAYLFVAIGVPWLVFAVLGYLKAKKGT